MPAKSKAQQHFFGMVRAMQKGKLQAKNLPKGVRAKVKKAASSMSTKDVKDYAKTKTKKLPKHVKEEEILNQNLSFTDYLVVEHTLAQEITADEAKEVEKAINEGPMDFVRGAAGEAGRMLGRTAPVRAARNIIGAGQAASQSADAHKKLQSLVSQFATVAQQLMQLQQQGVQTPAAQPAPPPAPTASQTAQAQQQPAAPPGPQATSPQPAAPGPIDVSPEERARILGRKQPMRRGPGARYGQTVMQSFKQHLEQNEEQLDEAFGDFLRGAVGAAGQMAKNYISSRVSPIARAASGVVAAGHEASAKADAAAQAKRRQQLQMQANALATQIAQITGNTQEGWAKVAQMLAAITKAPTATLKMLQQRAQQQQAAPAGA